MFIMLATIYTYVRYKLAYVEHEKGLWLDDIGEVNVHPHVDTDADTIDH